MIVSPSTYTSTRGNMGKDDNQEVVEGDYTLVG
jgi:hypothetical protein